MTSTTQNKKQELMKTARTSGAYNQIWQNTGECVFCNLNKKYIIYEENDVVLTVNLFAYIDGHMMAIPRQHITSPKQLTQKQWQTIRKYTYISKKILRKEYNIKSMWTLIREGGPNAQMTVCDHLHVQFIPFDQADLCQWNFRKLKYTPLENAKKLKNKQYLKKLCYRYAKKYE